MIIISEDIYKTLEEYEYVLVNDCRYSRTKERAREKKNLIIKALYDNLGGIVTHMRSDRKDLGSNEGYRKYVYTDKDSGTQWGFAYELFDDGNVIIHIMKNMSLVNDKNYSNNNQPQQKQIEYNPVSNQYYHGLMMVKSSNGLFNYVDENNQIFYPTQWFKKAEDFRKWRNGVIAARVASSHEWFFLTSDQKLYKGGDGSYFTENYQIILQRILTEQSTKTTSVIAYHFSDKFFKQFESKSSDSNGIFFTNSMEYNEKYPHKYTYKCHLNMNDPFIYDAEGKDWDELSPEMMKGSRIYDYYGGKIMVDKVVVWAESYGFDSVIVYNIREGENYDVLCNDYIMLNLRNVKILEITDNENYINEEVQKSLDFMWRLLKI